MTSRSRGPVALVSLLGAMLGVIALFWIAAGDHAGNAPTGSQQLGSVAAIGLPRIGLAESLADRQRLGMLVDPAVIAQVTCTLEITTTDRAPFNNHTLDTAATIANYTDQTLVPNGDPGAQLVTRPDFYRLDNAAVGYRYTIQAKPDWTTNYNLGIIVYNRDRVPIITDTNTFDNNFANVSLVATDFGPYYFQVFQISDQCSGHTYSLILGVTAPTATPTPTSTPLPGTTTPQPTSMIGFDQYEPNYDFTNATTIAPGISYDLNFIPWGGAEVDNDFLKLRVKPGLQVTCQTSDLDPGVDPRMAFYTGPGEQYFVAANDDIVLGDFNSRVSYFATYEGWLYVLVGQGSRMARTDTVNSDYTLSCNLSAPGVATPAPGYTPADKGASPPPATPRPTATPRTSVIATPTTSAAAQVELTFRLVSSPPPVTPTPQPNGFRTFRVMVYFDANLDGQMGAGEGVTGFFVLVLSPDGSEELAQGYTDEQGQLAFTVPTVGTVRVLVPLLGFDRLVLATKPEVRVRIIPPSLPEIIP